MSNKKIEEMTIKDISEKLDVMYDSIYKTLEAFSKMQSRLSEDIAMWLEERRKEDSEKDKGLQLRLNYQSIILGLLLGIIGNLFASYFMKVLEPLVTLWISWVIITFVGFTIILGIIYWFNLRIRDVAKRF